MFKISLQGFTAAGKALHRNILKPMARPAARDAAAQQPAAYYQDQRAAGAQPRKVGLKSKLGALFQAPKPTGPQAAPVAANRPVPEGAPWAPAQRSPGVASPGRDHLPRTGLAAAGFVLTPQQMPQMREQTLQRARGFAPPGQGAAPTADGNQALEKRLNLTRTYRRNPQALNAPALQPARGPVAMPKAQAVAAGQPQFITREMQRPSPPGAQPSEKVRPQVITKQLPRPMPAPERRPQARQALAARPQVAAQPKDAANPVQDWPEVPKGLPMLAQDWPEVPKGLPMLAQEWPEVPKGLPMPAQDWPEVPKGPPMPAQDWPEVPKGPPMPPQGRAHRAPDAQRARPWPAGAPAAPTGQPLTAVPVSTSRLGPLRASLATKAKQGQGWSRVRTLITADGTRIAYDKSHVQGGFGRFHRAQLADGTPRGLKQVRLPENNKTSPRKSMAHTTPLQAAEKEAAQMRALGMQVYGVHRTADGKAFIETELFAGSMAEKLQLVPINARSAVARQALRAMLTQLAPLHAKGSVHRDIKNDNLLFNHEGRIQIADPGLLITAQEIAASRSHGAAGTLRYMPPENFGAKVAKPAPGVDIWAAGCAYLEQLTHDWPARGTSGNALAANLRDFDQARESYLQGRSLPKNEWGKFLTRADKADREGTRFVLSYLMAANPRQRLGAAAAAQALHHTPYGGRGVLADVATGGLAKAAGSLGLPLV